MALDFPASPTNGQIFQGWVYNSTKGTWDIAPNSSVLGSHGIVDPYWTFGLPNVTLDSGQVVAAAGLGVTDLTPGDGVTLNLVNGNYYITGRDPIAPLFPKQIQITLPTGWTNYADTLIMQGSTSSAVTQWTQPAHRVTVSRTSASVVSLMGIAVNTSGASWAANTVLFTLPAVFRPLQQKRFVVYTTNGYVGLIVETTGSVYSDLAIVANTSLVFDVRWVNDATISWTNLTLTSPWVAQGGTNASTARVGKDALGRVWYEGYVKSGTSASSIANTPSGFQWNTGGGSAPGQIFNAYELEVSNRLGRVDTPPDTASAVTMISRQSGTSTGTSLDQIMYLPDALSASYVVPTFVVGSNYGNSYNPARWTIASDGLVHVQGVVAATGGSVLFVLPPGARPASVMRFQGNIDVYPDGRVLPVSTVSGQTLDGVTFIAEA